MIRSASPAYGGQPDIAELWQQQDVETDRTRRHAIARQSQKRFRRVTLSPW